MNKQIKYYVEYINPNNMCNGSGCETDTGVAAEAEVHRS